MPYTAMPAECGLSRMSMKCRRGHPSPTPSARIMISAGSYSPSLSKVIYRGGPQRCESPPVGQLHIDIVSASQLTLSLEGESSLWVEVRVQEEGLQQVRVLSRVEQRAVVVKAPGTCTDYRRQRGKTNVFFYRSHERSCAHCCCRLRSDFSC